MSSSARLATLSRNVAIGFFSLLVSVEVGGQQIDIPAPPGSVSFGRTVAVLPNGNIVVTDPNMASDAGAVYLYDPSGNLISVFTGSSADDRVGGGIITVLTNGNYVVTSPDWNNGAGAATWVNGSTGLSGVVSAANSLVGSTEGDNVGSGHVTALSNGHYVVASLFWNNGAITDAGAATWGNGNTGLSGVVSAANSLVGTTAGDVVGVSVTELSNGHYVVRSPDWDNGEATDAGAATWANGNTGVSGVVSAANSLVGITAFDSVALHGVTALSNGHYVVRSANWNNGAVTDAGAATWANGNTGASGVVSAANSLVGTTAFDRVGSDVTTLSNGHYVVASHLWDNGAATDAGAAIWGNGGSGVSGVISVTNSLVGTTAGDLVGLDVTPLSNGHYVVRSPYWDNGAVTNAGAATWGNGGSGVSGPVSAANSLVGTTANDNVGSHGVTALSNGHYVVTSAFWNGVGAATWGHGDTGLSGAVSVENSLVGTMASDGVGNHVTALNNGNYVVRSSFNRLGAVTWCNGSTGFSGVVSAANSLVGTTVDDRVGAGNFSDGITALSNGHYVVRSPEWDSGAATNAGAVTWGNGDTGVSGPVSAANSLVGTRTNDGVGGSVTPLSNGHYVVQSNNWDNGAATDAGAATWGNGNSGVSGVVSETNSLVGTTAGDFVGGSGAAALSNGHYLVTSSIWNNGAITGAGAVSLGRGSGGTIGPIVASNSVRGTLPQGGSELVSAYDASRDTLIVGQPAANLVSLFKTDLLFKNGFD